MIEPPIEALHRRLFKIDTHIDTPTASLMKADWNFGARHDFAVDGTQCDLPRTRDGGIDALVFAIYSTQAARTPEGFTAAHQRALRCFERTNDTIRQYSDQCGLARSAADARRLKSEKKLALYLSIENSYPLGRDAGNVQVFHDLGMCMLGLTHMLNNDVADSSTDPRGVEWGGLSPFGREVVAECNRLGVVVDASHASDDTLWDLLEVSTAPVILSHSDCRALCNHPRNIGDELLRALAAKGGVIQINALPVSLVDQGETAPRTIALSEMLVKIGHEVLTPELQGWADGEWTRIDTAYPNPRATLDDFLRHVEHAVDIAGIDHVGIGCDFDGGGGCLDGLNSVADYPNVTAALVARGWNEADLAKLWGGNTLRVLQAAAR